MTDYIDTATISSKTTVASLEIGYDEATISTVTRVISSAEWTIHLVTKDYFGNPLTADITYVYDSSVISGSVGSSDTDDGILS